MQRRSFLKEASLAVAGGAGLLGGDAQAAPQPAGVTAAPASPDRTGTVLVTSAESLLGRAVATALAPQYRLRLSSLVDLQTSHPFTKCSLGHDAATGALVRGVGTIVHVASSSAGGEAERIDYHSRCTCNLLWAAAQEHVPRLVYLSSLAMMTGYDESLAVNEDWRPRPSSPGGGLPECLGEMVCREFAREGKLDAIVLRIGNVPAADAAAGRSDPLGVDPRDVAQAVSKAVAAMLREERAPQGRWSVFHVLSDGSQARFPIAKAKQALGYQPRQVTP